VLYKFFWVIRALFFKSYFKEIGFPSYIGKPTFLMGGRRVYIGKYVRVFPGMRLEVHGEGILNIKDDVSIGQNLHLACGKKITIESGVVISGNVLIIDIDHSYDDLEKSVLNQKDTYKETYIGENCFLGHGAKVLAGTNLGRNCIVGANAVVRGTYADYSILAGNPAKVIKSFNGEKWVKHD